MADVAVRNKDAGPLKATPPDDYLHFREKILDDCKKKYFEINNVDNSKGQKEWKAVNIDQLSTRFLAALNPEEWKTYHLPESALKFIENHVKSFTEGEDKANSIEGNASFTILVMGRGGVGKSSTANSIIGADVFPVNKTKGSQEILIWSGSTSNFTLRIIEIPEFMHYGQVHIGYFEAIKLFWKVYKISALLYVDRLDEFKKDHLMDRNIANIASFFGPRILNRALIVLTHRISSSEEHIEYRSEFIKRKMVIEAEQSCSLVVEDDALEAVAVDNMAYLPGNKNLEWMDELFEGLNKISVRASRSPDDEIRCSKWMFRPDPTFFSWLDRDYSLELLEKVRVMISVRNK